MKARYLALLTAPLFSTAVLASSYTGPGAAAQISTVAAALEAADDAPVVLQGQIVRRLKGDIYEFKDVSGTIKVEIDDEDWPPQAIDDKATVKLTGEVDRDLMGREVDVEFVERVN
ncbi:NirD/YgiW/YdeI family stress tolerance protein [Metapseudomonas boanensis]|uniref:NirD/YgiW/YdeI family stress tolerance protein n=1 Tax=Metapseudomonas boanensis TaxID=2822138 RepID=A0ABS5XJG5_9GAMM|nr:NirD/YgiW/YdeI family stress tolerance protein [Pseudomonas boanensis]MBT8767806.1 NirD/YgiW/YdeI family stress tolerance protein [Pseudomonas boanensis]